MIHRNFLIATAIIASVVITACLDTTAPKSVVTGRVAAAVVAPSSAESFPRSGALHVTKECTQYTRLAGGFCTITSSNVAQIEVGTRVVYAVASGPTVLDSDVRLDPPGPGNNIAYGHVVLDLASGQGVVTISGGTGKFTWFHADVVVTRIDRALRTWSWDGTYSFDPRD